MKFKHSNDSMELLLDAMCNVFGAVLLTAILIGGAETVKSIANPVGTVEKKLYLQAAKELQLLESRQRSADLETAMLQALPQPPAAPQADPAPELMQKYRQYAAELNTLAEKIESTERSIAENKSLLEFINTQSDTDLPTPETGVLNLTGSHRTTGLQPWRLLITAQGVYVVGSNTMIRRGSSRDSAVEIKHFESGRNDFYRITPQPGRAVKLQDFRLELPAADNPEHPGYFAELLVQPDAIAPTALLIKNLRQNNIPYHWRIVSGNGALLRTAAGGKYEVSR